MKLWLSDKAAKAAMEATPVTKVVFVDVDGPLAPRRCYQLGQLPGVGGSMKRMDPVAVATVTNACRRSGARIVVSSSWRMWGREKCLDLFNRNGLDPALVHEDWSTSHTLPRGADRSAEIKDWLARHPEIERFAVLEDGHLDVPNLIHVTFEDGILYEHQLMLERFLGIRPEQIDEDSDPCRHRWLAIGQTGHYRCERCEDTAAPGDPRCPWTAGVGGAM